MTTAMASEAEIEAAAKAFALRLRGPDEAEHYWHLYVTDIRAALDAAAAVRAKTEVSVPSPKAVCDHAAAPVAFDEEAAKGLDEYEVRKRWPRFNGNCPTCGTMLIKYASPAHYFAGDW